MCPLNLNFKGGYLTHKNKDVNIIYKKQTNKQKQGEFIVDSRKEIKLIASGTTVTITY
jgi:hypothetical protein